MSSSFSRVRSALSTFSTTALVLNIAVGSLVAALPVFSPIAAAATFGPSNAGAGANVTGVGSVNWSNAGFIIADDTNYATATLGASATSRYLQGTNYGFAIPTGATINGIQVSIMRETSDVTLGASIDDNIVRLVKAGTIVGDNKATSADWPTSMTAASYGGPSDLWGTTWTAAEINASNFGVVLSILNEGIVTSRTGRVDYMQITVTYTLSTGTIHVTKTAVGGDGTFNFTNAASFAITTTGGTGTHDITDLSPASYSVDETAPTGWTVTSNGCQNVSVTAGNTTNCTITNTKLGTVTVIKNSLPVSAQSFPFTTTIGGGEGGFSLSDDGEGSEDTVEFTSVALGSHTITEGSVAGWSLTGLVCTGGDADGSTDLVTRTATIDVDAGEHITCTFTNSQYGTLHITKNAYGGDDEFDFTIDGEGSDVLESASITTTAGTGTADVSLPVGDYNVSETLPESGAWQQVSNGCSFAVIQPGLTTNCTVENVKRTRISVGKETTNGGEANFTFTRKFGSSSSSSFSRGVTEPGVPVGLDSFFEIFASVSSSSAAAIPVEIVELNLLNWNFNQVQCTLNESPMSVTPQLGEDGVLIGFNAQAGDQIQCLFNNRMSVCGNSVVQSGEQCDDGNATVGDGCSDTCQYELGWSCNHNEPSVCTTSCGDNIVAGVEECDNDLTNTSGDGCDAFCHIEVCGDGVINNTHVEGETTVTEQCDDGDDDAGDGCSDTCQIEIGYACPTVNESCVAICGDGLVLGGEQCDDGESSCGDGCSSSCEVETGYQCINSTETDPNSTCELHLDFGDAPDGEGEDAGYPTLLEDNGARHVIVEEYMLGATIDGEPNGQPDFAAAGDGSDEDGVSFTTSLTQGATAGVTVVTSLPDGEGEDDGYLEAWVDFNQDGDWDDEGEHVIDNLSLTSGTHALTFSVPAGAVLGETYARFRWSSIGGIEESGLDVTGYAPNGEVEDYLVTITAPVTETTSDDEDEGPVSDDGGNGGSRGSQTNRIGAAINRLISNFIGDTPPPAFGGTDDAPFSDEQNDLLRRINLMIGCNASNSVFHAAAQIIAKKFSGNTAAIEAQMQLICTQLAERSGMNKPVVQIKPRQIVLAEDGYPVSSDDLWNLCVRGKATLADFRSHPMVIDRDTGKTASKTCGLYRISGTQIWKFPDDLFLTGLIINPSKSGKPVVSVFQKGYAVLPSAQRTAEASSAAAQ